MLVHVEGQWIYLVLGWQEVRPVKYDNLFVQDGLIVEDAETDRDYTTLDVSIFSVSEATPVDLALHHLCCKRSQDIVLFRINEGEWIWC